MGEGIRNAKIVSLLKKPGEQIQLDDELCEVETDKAVYPIQSSFAGVMGEWKTKIGDTVEIGQELGTIVTSEPAFAEQFEAAAKESDRYSRETVDAAASAPAASVKRPGSSPASYSNRACAFADYYAQTESRYSCQPPNRRALERNSGSAAGIEKDGPRTGSLPFHDDCMGGRARDGKTCAVSPVDSRRRSDRAE